MEVLADALFFLLGGVVHGFFESGAFVHFVGELAVGVFELGGAFADGAFDGAGAVGEDGEEECEEECGGEAADEDEQRGAVQGLGGRVVGGGFAAEDPGLIGDGDGVFGNVEGIGGGRGCSEGGVEEGDLHVVCAGLAEGAVQEGAGPEDGEGEAGEGSVLFDGRGDEEAGRRVGVGIGDGRAECGGVGLGHFLDGAQLAGECGEVEAEREVESVFWVLVCEGEVFGSVGGGGGALRRGVEDGSFEGGAEGEWDSLCEAEGAEDGLLVGETFIGEFGEVGRRDGVGEGMEFAEGREDAGEEGHFAFDRAGEGLRFGVEFGGAALAFADLRHTRGPECQCDAEQEYGDCDQAE